MASVPLLAASSAQAELGRDSGIHSQLPPINRRRKSRAIEAASQSLPSSQMSLFTLATRSRIALDPIKAVEPYRKKLTNTEALRIISVLDELRVKCQLIVRLPAILQDPSLPNKIAEPAALEVLRRHAACADAFKASEMCFNNITRGMATPMSRNADESHSGSRGPRDWLQSLGSASASLAARRQLSTRIREDVLPETSELSTSDCPSAESIAEAETCLKENRLALEFSVRNVLRELRDDDQLTQKLSLYSRTREGNYFTQCLAELCEIVLERLLISPPEEYEKIQFTAQIAAQDKLNQLVIRQLEEELDNVTKQRDAELAVKNNMITTLQHNLRNLESATEDDIRRARAEAEKQTMTDTRSSDARKHKLTSELKSVTSTLNGRRAENRDEEQVLRKKKWKIESEIENWIQRYDSEMSQKQDEYEEIDAVYQEEQKQLKELEHRFSSLEAEYKSIIELRTKEKKRLDEAARLLEKQTQAALIIQALWRSFKVRSLARNRVKQQKKNSKKKKGK